MEDQQAGANHRKTAVPWFGTRRSKVRILPPRPFLSITYRRLAEKQPTQAAYRFYLLKRQRSVKDHEPNLAQGDAAPSWLPTSVKEFCLGPCRGKAPLRLPAPLNQLPWDVAKDHFGVQGADFIWVMGLLIIRAAKDHFMAYL